MGTQSSRLYFDGKDHKDIYYQGKYHTAMYKGNTLLWAKTEFENISCPNYPLYMKEIDGELYGIYDTGYIWKLASSRKDFGLYAYSIVSNGISAHWVGDNAIFQENKIFPPSTSEECFRFYYIKENKSIGVQTLTDNKVISEVSKTVTNWKHEAGYAGFVKYTGSSLNDWSYDSYILGSLNSAVGYANIEEYLYLNPKRVDTFVVSADMSVYNKPTVYAVANDKKNQCVYTLCKEKTWLGTASTRVYKIKENNGKTELSFVSTPKRNFLEYADIDVIDGYLLIYGTGPDGQIYVMNLTKQEEWYCGVNQEYKGFYRILKKADNSYYLLENNDRWINIYKSADMKTWEKVFHDDGLVYVVSGINSAVFFESDLYISTISTSKYRVLRIKGI